MIGFTMAALAVMAAATLLAASAREIAVASGISTTFIGTSLVAVTTSLPELVTALAAVRLGAFDLAVGDSVAAAMPSIWLRSCLRMPPIAVGRS